MPKFEPDEKSPMSKRASEKNSVQQVDVEPLNQYVCERVKYLRKKKGLDARTAGLAQWRESFDAQSG
jgi:hypothetical protein